MIANFSLPLQPNKKLQEMRSVLYNIIRCSNGQWDACRASYGTASPMLSLSRNTGIAGISHVLNLFIIGLFCMRRTGLFAIVNPNNLIT